VLQVTVTASASAAGGDRGTGDTWRCTGWGKAYPQSIPAQNRLHNVASGCPKAQTDSDSDFQGEKATLCTDYWDNKELREVKLLLRVYTVRRDLTVRFIVPPNLTDKSFL